MWLEESVRGQLQLQRIFQGLQCQSYEHRVKRRAVALLMEGPESAIIEASNSM
jgi:hypothetical protein